MSIGGPSVFFPRPTPKCRRALTAGWIARDPSDGGPIVPRRSHFVHAEKVYIRPSARRVLSGANGMSTSGSALSGRNA